MLGISHFIEHMFFKGTQKRSTKEIAQTLDRVGGYLNGFTTKEYMSLNARILDEHLNIALDLLSDMFLNSIFDSKEIEKEKKVIIEEIKMYEDNPEELITDLFIQTIFKDSSLGQPILGNKNNILHFTKDNLISFMKKIHSGENFLITASGNLNHNDIVKFANKTFSSLKNTSFSSLPIFFKKPKIIIKNKKLEQFHLCLGIKTIPYVHPDRFVLSILNIVLGSGMSSRLFQKIREEKGLAYSIYSFLESYKTDGTLGIYAGTSKKSLNQVIKLILKEINLIKKEGISCDELKIAKEQLKGHIMLSMESINVRMKRLANAEIYFNNYFTLNEIIERINKISQEDILRIAEELIKKENFKICAIGPNISKIISKNIINEK
ncbi:MAG: pitrilysin family protein [bacterium]